MPDVPAFLDRRKAKRLVYSYSNLNGYLTCPEQFQQRYIAKTLPYVETEAMKKGNAVHAALEARVGAGKLLPAELAAWEPWAAPFDNRGARVEQKLAVDEQGRGVDFWDDQAWLRGKLDLFLLNDNHAYLHDWKSGSSKYEDPFELEIGALLLACNEGQRIKMFGCYNYETGLSQVYDLSDVKGAWAKVREIVAQIERDRAASAWEKKRSGLCQKWCDVLTCEHNGRRKR